MKRLTQPARCRLGNSLLPTSFHIAHPEELPWDQELCPSWRGQLLQRPSNAGQQSAGGTERWQIISRSSVSPSQCRGVTDLQRPAALSQKSSSDSSEHSTVQFHPRVPTAASAQGQANAPSWHLPTRSHGTHFSSLTDASVSQETRSIVLTEGSAHGILNTQPGQGGGLQQPWAEPPRAGAHFAYKRNEFQRKRHIKGTCCCNLCYEKSCWNLYQCRRENKTRISFWRC